MTTWTVAWSQKRGIFQPQHFLRRRRVAGTEKSDAFAGNQALLPITQNNKKKHHETQQNRFGKSDGRTTNAGTDFPRISLFEAGPSRERPRHEGSTGGLPRSNTLRGILGGHRSSQIRSRPQRLPAAPQGLCERHLALGRY